MFLVRFSLIRELVYGSNESDNKKNKENDIPTTPVRRSSRIRKQKEKAEKTSWTKWLDQSPRGSVYTNSLELYRHQWDLLFLRFTFSGIKLHGTNWLDFAMVSSLPIFTDVLWHSNIEFVVNSTLQSFTYLAQPPTECRTVLAWFHDWQFTLSKKCLFYRFLSLGNMLQAVDRMWDTISELCPCIICMGDVTYWIFIVCPTSDARYCIL